ncbi:HlyU family transcriptional regulator [Pleomorphomonas sp. JP5]|uniref:HlyU family transcriptional regulator n=1 Tax=Pleomorphomonas sp. JP5 TaxID=2942998 RepID=UPI0020437954|nr:HlyU family transcriptional regulator [Pleomorphomonas sp. JP5]MCM5557598.1 HlyU family transcriptional regulator [Pleomorphomonas sp. JP5]
MSFLKKLFGLGGGAPAADKPAETQDYKGFKIAATPFKDGGQWQLCGVVSLEEDGVTREHRFIRADKFSDADQAKEMAFEKGRLIVDQLGKSVFE